MSIGTADVHKAVANAWFDKNRSVHGKFTALWPLEKTTDEGVSDWTSLYDQEAPPGQPHPYCVMGESSEETMDRMSGSGQTLREVRDVSITLQIHAKAVDGDARTAKEIAAYLYEEVAKLYCGHPTQAPINLRLDNGNFLLTQYVNDFGIKTGDDEYQWTFEFLVRVDVPTAIPAEA